MGSTNPPPPCGYASWKRVDYVNCQLPFYASAVIIDDIVTFKFTNMMHLWEEILDAQVFNQKLLDLNANVTGDVSPLHDNVVLMVLGLDPSCTYSSVKITEEMLEVECKCLLSGLPLLWKITAKQASPEAFFVEIIRPLMAIVMHNERREKELILQITTRDRFIEDLREGTVESPKKMSKWTKFDSRHWHKDYFNSEQAAEVQQCISSCTRGPFDENSFNEKLKLLEATRRSSKQEQPVTNIPPVIQDSVTEVDEEIPEENEITSSTVTVEKTPKKKTRRLLRL